MYRFRGFVLGVAISSAVLSGALTIAPTVEGRLFPVVDQTSIEVTPIGDRAMVIGSAHKRRSCDFLRLEWFYGDPNGLAVRVPVEFREGTKLRDEGWFDFGPWLLSLRAEFVEGQSYALVYHRCHPLWVTVSELWPSGQ